MQKLPSIILASKSPRRHQLLRESGFEFVIAEIEVDEDFPSDLKKQEVAEYLANKKAMHYTQTIHPSVLVCADTIVCIEDQILNKPADREEAFSMLRFLSGKTHEVYTGVCLKNENRIHTFSEKSEVTFYALTDHEIWHYIDHYAPFDKAGSYGVQDWMGYCGVKKINGCFYNVMGFPVSRFYHELLEFISGS